MSCVPNGMCGCKIADLRKGQLAFYDSYDTNLTPVLSESHCEKLTVQIKCTNSDMQLQAGNEDG